MGSWEYPKSGLLHLYLASIPRLLASAQDLTRASMGPYNACVLGQTNQWWQKL